MRIFYIIDSYVGPTAGTEKQLLLLISKLVERGHEVKLFVLRHSEYTEQTADFPCPIEVLDIRSFFSLSSLRRLLRLRTQILRSNPCVVHAFFIDSNIIAPLLLKSRSTTVFTSRRDMGYWYTPFKLAALRLANLRANRVVCNCQAVADLVQSKERLSVGKLAVIRNGVDPNQPVESITAADQSKSNMFCSNNTNIVLVANLRALKRIEDLILAAALNRQSIPNARYFIAGSVSDKAYEASLRTLIANADLQDQVHFIEHMTNPFLILRLSHVGVLTSSSEGLSNTLLEYLHAGLPIVCSNVGGNSEIVTEGKNGFLYDAANVDQLADRLYRLCSDQALRLQMGRRSQERAKDFSVRSMVTKHESEYFRQIKHK